METIEPSDVDEAAGPRLRAIADELVRIAPSRTDPHAYFQTKSDLVHELRRLALGLDQVVLRSLKVGGTAHFSVRLRNNGAVAVSPKPDMLASITNGDAAKTDNPDVQKRRRCHSARYPFALPALPPSAGAADAGPSAAAAQCRSVRMGEPAVTPGHWLVAVVGGLVLLYLLAFLMPRG
jgi:hypothetical protein